MFVLADENLKDDKLLICHNDKNKIIDSIKKYEKINDNNFYFDDDFICYGDDLGIPIVRTELNVFFEISSLLKELLCIEISESISGESINELYLVLVCENRCGATNIYTIMFCDNMQDVRERVGDFIDCQHRTCKNHTNTEDEKQCKKSLVDNLINNNFCTFEGDPGTSIECCDIKLSKIY